MVAMGAAMLGSVVISTILRYVRIYFVQWLLQLGCHNVNKQPIQFTLQYLSTR